MTDTATAPEPVAEGRPLAKFGFDSVIDDNPGWRYLWGRDGWNDSPPLPALPAITAEEPRPAAVTVPELAATEPAHDVPAEPQTIAEQAADRLGIAAPDKAADDKFAAFSASFTEDPEGEGDRAQPDTTAQIAAVGDDTQVIEGDAK